MISNLDSISSPNSPLSCKLHIHRLWDLGCLYLWGGAGGISALACLLWLMNWLFVLVWMTTQWTLSYVHLCVSLVNPMDHLPVNGIFESDHFHTLDQKKKKIKVLKFQSWLGRRTGGKFSAKEKFSELGGDHFVPLLHPTYSVWFCFSL